MDSGTAAVLGKADATAPGSLAALLTGSGQAAASTPYSQQPPAAAAGAGVPVPLPADQAAAAMSAAVPAGLPAGMHSQHAAQQQQQQQQQQGRAQPPAQGGTSTSGPAAGEPLIFLRLLQRLSSELIQLPADPTASNQGCLLRILPCFFPRGTQKVSAAAVPDTTAGLAGQLVSPSGLARAGQRPLTASPRAVDYHPDFARPSMPQHSHQVSLAQLPQLPPLHKGVTPLHCSCLHPGRLHKATCKLLPCPYQRQR